ncbi:bifunctional nicotinamide-nucleotide adenylyltransferase/Nudix hydroxylase [Chitiniphilus purpureus]|uniref:Bifunctional nicotinamide-nucleotide adenylyltransferase/Nudix hydroxylase n=1 Tax=Chitiniphilus purpureus TaxID=2981137 RepID=A0ABY6DN52_9NEIS|nr:bifunctional nicotinamide-nucleotide adenylyltransferase/Nudix hydroxylase [Chitiniphilus sp. CD1]UXY15757.1 bifunctional nicotinamide-nucleotide adenylyltransferase/Nudix hydroxylase [Chitiniphilus sp. CD1]
MSHDFDCAVLIGRFQPFHLGHAVLLAEALRRAPQVMVVLGSAHRARDAKNPFTWQERAAMIAATLPEADAGRVRFVPVRDYYDDARWTAAVQAGIAGDTPSRRVALIGHEKDASSYYLQRFPDWTLVRMPLQGELDATGVRQIHLGLDEPAAADALLTTLVPHPVAAYLKGWRALPAYAQLCAEHAALIENRKRWGSGPFVTVDAVVEVAGHVLLVERKHMPGQGLWALPGGFLDGRERLLQGAIRELREETGLALFDSTLHAALRGVAVFDHPDRSLRGRTITHAHHFGIAMERLPEVAGSDDAADARWVPIAELAAMESRFFEDHFHILDHFLQLTG